MRLKKGDWIYSTTHGEIFEFISKQSELNYPSLSYVKNIRENSYYVTLEGIRPLVSGELDKEIKKILSEEIKRILIDKYTETI